MEPQAAGRDAPSVQAPADAVHHPIGLAGQAAGPVRDNKGTTADAFPRGKSDFLGENGRKQTPGYAKDISECAGLQGTTGQDRRGLLPACHDRLPVLPARVCPAPSRKNQEKIPFRR